MAWRVSTCHVLRDDDDDVDDVDDVVDGDKDDICTTVNDDEGGSRHHSPWHCQVALHYTLQ